MDSVRIFTLGITLTIAAAGCAGSNSGPAVRSVASAESTATQPPNSGESNTQDVVLTVHGMSCPLCATNVDKQLLKIPGVENVKVNLKSGEVRVRVSKEQPPPQESLVKAIQESGFTLVGQPQQQ